MADLDAARELERAGAVGRGVARAHLGGLDGAVGGEVAARRRGRTRACPGSFAPVIQRVPGDDARVEQVPHGGALASPVGHGAFGPSTPGPM